VPIDYSRYPDNWQELRAQVLADAQGKCERCGVANYAEGARDIKGVWHNEHDIDRLNSDVGYYLFDGEYPKIIKIILTVAHLDHDIKNNERSNLAALCQRCHFSHDRQDNAEKRKATAQAKKAAEKKDAGYQSLF